MSGENTKATPHKSGLRDLLPVVTVLLISLSATYATWQYESRRVTEQSDQRFQRLSHGVQADVIATMQVYGQFLRGGVGLFHATDEVTRDSWGQYVNSLALGENFPGIQGVSYNAVVRGPDARAAFEQQVRSTGWADFAIKPAGDRDLYIPVVYLEPLNKRNERAIGFDIYSETVRRAAIDTAIATGDPSMTAPIVLVQENPESDQNDVQSGVLVILPVFEDGVVADDAARHTAAPTGMIVSVFRLGDLMNSVVGSGRGSRADYLHIRLHDAAAADDNGLLFETPAKDSNRTEKFHYSDSFALFGRVWTLQTSSSPTYEAAIAATAASPAIIAGGGVLLSLLLTALAWGQAERARESKQTASTLLENNTRIQLLMHEVNHRSKNLLAVVRAIARQTASADPDQFVSRFSQRIESLSASQDVLVRNAWKGTPMFDLATSQLSHFADLIGQRVLLQGPRLQLNTSAAQTVGMSFHELATNAGKYGALSNGGGTVDVRWQIKKDDGGHDRLHLSWIETGGPPVGKPQKPGFGSFVLGMMAERSLNARITTSYEPSGFAWHMDCPLDMAQEVVEAEA